MPTTPETVTTCTCDPRHIEIGGCDHGCPVHDPWPVSGTGGLHAERALPLIEVRP